MEKESKKAKKKSRKGTGKEKDEEKERWSLEALGRSGVTAGKAPYRAAEQCGMIG